MDDFLNRYDKIQKLNNSKPRFNSASDAATMMTLFVTGISIGLVAMVALRACDKAPEPAHAAQKCQTCHAANQQTRLTHYFRKNGSRNPEEMANAVLNTRTPRLLASVAVVETGGNTHNRSGQPIRNTGYKKQHSGAFQVNPKYWGKVPHDAAGQAQQAEAILSELAETMPIKKALSVYGGDSTSKYQRRVLAELVRVP